jgi:formamidopyrimidine-DNA glycosylase
MLLQMGYYMPELPEVEVVCRGLSSLILGDVIEKTSLKCLKLRNNLDENLHDIVKDRKIISITRKAKYILMNLSDNITLIVHLGMTGNLVVHDRVRSSHNKHEHVIFYLKSGRELAYQDIRRFGLITFCKTDEINEHHLFLRNGPEPLEGGFNAKYLKDKLNSRSIAIKQALMDNLVVVGVGNIYACEILFKSKISPFRNSKDISFKEAGALVENTKLTLREAIKAGGSSFSDYINAKGESGYFQHSFAVYQRQNQVCNNCLYPISRVKQGGRSSFFCVNCQV